jgi:hypothetical protein
MIVVLDNQFHWLSFEAKIYGKYSIKVYKIVANSVADPDPGSGDPWIRDPE